MNIFLYIILLWVVGNLTKKFFDLKNDVKLIFLNAFNDIKKSEIIKINDPKNANTNYF